MGAKADLALHCSEAGTLDNASASWHAAFVPLGSLLLDAHAVGSYSFVIAVLGPMLYLQPTCTDRTNKITFLGT